MTVEQRMYNLWEIKIFGSWRSSKASELRRKVPCFAFILHKTLFRGTSCREMIDGRSHVFFFFIKNLAHKCKTNMQKGDIVAFCVVPQS